MVVTIPSRADRKHHGDRHIYASQGHPKKLSAGTQVHGASRTIFNNFLEIAENFGGYNPQHAKTRLAFLTSPEEVFFDVVNDVQVECRYWS